VEVPTLGLYDYVRVPAGLIPECPHTEFQTKDFEPSLAVYEIRGGRLYRVGGAFGEDDGADPEVPLSFHGYLHFYKYDNERRAWDYRAKFTDGALVSLEPVGVPGQCSPELESAVLSARDQAISDTYSAWVNWMSFESRDRGLLGAVEWPAISMRLDYLRGNCAWGYRGFDIAAHAQDLRRWLEWVEARPGEWTPGLEGLVRSARKLFELYPDAAEPAA
jgi:hypothetical protein